VSLPKLHNIFTTVLKDGYAMIVPQNIQKQKAPGLRALKFAFY